MQVFKFPLQLLANGHMAMVDQDSPAGSAEAVAAIVLTRVGERPLAPSFGIPDPAFSSIRDHDVVAAVSTFLPKVSVRSITAEPVTSHTQQVHVEIGDANAQP